MAEGSDDVSLVVMSSIDMLSVGKLLVERVLVGKSSVDMLSVVMLSMLMLLIETVLVVMLGVDRGSETSSVIGPSVGRVAFATRVGRLLFGSVGVSEVGELLFE